MLLQLAFLYSIFLPSSSLVLKLLRLGFRNNNLRVKLFLSQVCAYTHAKSMALKKADFKQPLSNALIPPVPGSHHGPRARLSMPSRVLSAWCFPQSHTDCLFSHKFLTSFLVTEVPLGDFYSCPSSETKSSSFGGPSCQACR